MAKHQNPSKPYTFKTSTDSLQQSCLLKDLNSFILYSGPAARLQLEGPNKLANSKLHVSSHPSPLFQKVHNKYGCVLLENPKTDLWSQIIWILHFQKRKIWKRIIYHDSSMSSCSLRWEKIKEGKDNKESDINYVWIPVYKMYIFRFETQMFLKLNAPYKNLKLKWMYFFFITWKKKMAWADTTYIQKTWQVRV